MNLNLSWAAIDKISFFKRNCPKIHILTKLLLPYKFMTETLRICFKNQFYLFNYSFIFIFGCCERLIKHYINIIYLLDRRLQESHWWHFLFNTKQRAVIRHDVTNVLTLISRQLISNIKSSSCLSLSWMCCGEHASVFELESARALMMQVSENLTLRLLVNLNKCAM